MATREMMGTTRFLFFEEMGKLFTAKVGKLLTRLLGNYLTATLGKVLDIYNFNLSLTADVAIPYQIRISFFNLSPQILLLLVGCRLERLVFC